MMNRRRPTDLATVEECERVGLDPTARFGPPVTLADVHNADRTHRAYDADYCPLCQTAVQIGR